MKHLVIGFVLLLAACASMEAKSPAQRVYAIQADYNALLSAAVAYESQPRCVEGQSRVNPCSDPKAVAEIRKGDDAAAAALKAAQDTVRTPGATANAVSLALTGASNAVAALRSILTTYGVM